MTFMGKENFLNRKMDTKESEWLVKELVEKDNGKERKGSAREKKRIIIKNGEEREWNRWRMVRGKKQELKKEGKIENHRKEKKTK